MTVFYNPQKRKPQSWIFIVFIIAPIVVVIIVWLFGKNMAKQKSVSPTSVTEEDIFKK